MQRVPETECMDTPDEAREYAAMDHGDANQAFVDALLAHGLVHGELLDLGTGPGDIPLLIVDKADVQITAIDMSTEMLKIARLKVAQAGRSNAIRLMVADAKDLPFGDDCFDGVFSNTILHHVSDPHAFFREARRVLRPGGGLVIRDLFRPDTIEAAEALVALHAAEGTPEQQRLLLDSLKASYTVPEIRAMLDECGLGDARVEQTSDRHLTIWLRAS